MDLIVRKFIALFSLLFATAALPVGQTYDPKTGIYEMPGSPISPTSSVQCDTLQQQWSQLQQALEDGHQKCLDAHRREAEDPRASLSGSNPVCSHPACQSLHTARTDVRQKAEDRVRACRADVAQYQKRKQVEQEQQQALQRRQQERSDAAKQALEQQAEQAQFAQQKRRDAVEKIAAAVIQNREEVDQRLRAKRDADSGISSLTASEFGSLNPPPSQAAVEQQLAPSTPSVKSGNPPDDLADRWKAGRPQQGADGFYNKQVYVWQFSTDDEQLCPAVSIGGASIVRQALFQETATAHYQLANGLIVHSDIEKQRGFLRCLSPGEEQDYPKYLSAPFYFKTKGTVASGVRD